MDDQRVTAAVRPGCNWYPANFLAEIVQESETTLVYFQHLKMTMVKQWVSSAVQLTRSLWHNTAHLKTPSWTLHRHDCTLLVVSVFTFTIYKSSGCLPPLEPVVNSRPFRI